MTASVPLDLSPAPGAAPARSRWRAQARLEWFLLMSNGEQLLLTLVIPVAVLIGVVRLDLATVELAAPGALALAVLSSAFTATAIATGFERRSGVLKYLGTTPLARSGLLVGKALATLAVIALQAVVVTVTALALGWDPRPAAPIVLVAALVLGTAALGSWGFALAGLLRAEATLAVANAIFLVLLLAGGVVVPVTRAPAVLSGLLSVLPSSALADALRAAWGVGSGGAGADMVVLLCWALGGVALAARTFRWE